MKAPMTKHQLPNNTQYTMTKCSLLEIGACDLVITSEGGR
jgi:hypothetical protein